VAVTTSLHFARTVRAKVNNDIIFHIAGCHPFPECSSFVKTPDVFRYLSPFLQKLDPPPVVADHEVDRVICVLTVLRDRVQTPAEYGVRDRARNGIWPLLGSTAPGLHVGGISSSVGWG
jgi:hypothetical protein